MKTVMIVHGIPCVFFYNTYFQMREKQWITVSQDAKDLVNRMLEVDAEHRITVEEALAHPWIRVRTVGSKLAGKSKECCLLLCAEKTDQTARMCRVYMSFCSFSCALAHFVSKLKKKMGKPRKNYCNDSCKV